MRSLLVLSSKQAAALLGGILQAVALLGGSFAAEKDASRGLGNNKLTMGQSGAVPHPAAFANAIHVLAMREERSDRARRKMKLFLSDSVDDEDDENDEAEQNKEESQKSEDAGVSSAIIGTNTEMQETTVASASTENDGFNSPHFQLRRHEIAAGIVLIFVFNFILFLIILMWRFIFVPFSSSSMKTEEVKNDTDSESTGNTENSTDKNESAGIEIPSTNKKDKKDGTKSSSTPANKLKNFVKKKSSKSTNGSWDDIKLTGSTDGENEFHEIV